MSLVAGINMAGYLYRDGSWVPWICARDITFNVTTEFVDVSGKGTGNWGLSKPTRNMWTATSGGIVSLNSTDLTLGDLRTIQYTQERVLLRCQRIAEDGTVYTDQGYAYITSSSDTGSFDNVGTFQVEFKGTGPITQIYTPVETGGNVTRYEYTGVGGEYVIESANLYLKDVLFVDKDGIGRARIITVGTPDPATKEVLYESNIGGGLGRLTFSQPFEANEMCVHLTQPL